MLVQGPYLVRSASLKTETKTLELTGDIDNSNTTIRVFAPRKACLITWNGERLKIESKDGNLITARIAGPKDFELPALGPWKYNDGLPEVDPQYALSSNAWVGKYACELEFHRQER